MNLMERNKISVEVAAFSLLTNNKGTLFSIFFGSLILLFSFFSLPLPPFPIFFPSFLSSRSLLSRLKT